MMACNNAKEHQTSVLSVCACVFRVTGDRDVVKECESCSTKLSGLHY